MNRWLRELRPTGFLKLAVILVVLGRIALILLTPRSDQGTDLSIYQEVGELLVNGVDPYDFSSQAPLRDKLRLNDYGADSYVNHTRERYDYYVSGNLPASTALYGLLEIVSGGNPKIWRIAFVLGDVSIVLAAFFFLRRAGVGLQAPIQKLAFLAGAVAYPSLIEWGTLWPADKQFQTALMMLLAGLLISQPKSPIRASVAIGIVGSLSILFKALGLFLLPLACWYFYKRPRREFTTAVLAGLATALPFMALFNVAFIQLMVNRVMAGSAATTAAYHGSPWIFFPDFFMSSVRPLVCAALVATIAIYHWKGKIDLLNCMAALNLVFICLWTNGGSMDRLNIAMMFALLCTATMSVRHWQTLTLFNYAIQAPVYAYYGLQHFRRWPAQGLQSFDAAVTVIFLVSYFFILFGQPRLDGWRRSSTRASAS
jgi:hypothetical protein